MKLAKILLSAVLPTLSLTAAAQSGDYTPSKGDFTVAATFGYNSYANVSAPAGNLTDYQLSAATTMWNDKKLMVGFEAGWFASDNWKLNLGGGLNFTHNPGHPSLPGTIDGTTTPSLGDIPNYSAVASQFSSVYNVYLGTDRIFNTGVQNLQWHTGLRVGFAYALNEQCADDEESMGTSVGECWNLRGSVTMGVNYYVLPAMYVGFEIEPFQYTYNMSTVRPQPGLNALRANGNTFSILAAPTLKLGFKF